MVKPYPAAIHLLRVEELGGVLAVDLALWSAPRSID
jgi:hypothetical protein